ncbi:MAG: AarF/ABC1/UbiB kinase family protein [Roseiflexaceae bacterium]|nr:AarF/ABC1/UbiB kinase family protein [Roseiflexaceae bacterium]
MQLRIHRMARWLAICGTLTTSACAAPARLQQDPPSLLQVILGLCFFAVVLTALGWLGGRLLGGRPSWRRALLAALFGVLTGGAFAWNVASQTTNENEVNPLTIYTVALLMTMGVFVILELMVIRRSEPAQPDIPVLPPPRQTLRLRLERARRYCTLVWPLFRYGLWPYLRGQWNGPANRRQQSLALNIRIALEDAGGAFVKLGQMLSTRPDIIPPVITAELAQLQDHIPPVPYSVIEALLTKELGVPPADYFATFDVVPIAAASIAQVHRAQLQSGELVVVKIQRPGIRASIKSDIAILLGLARMAGRRTAWGRDMQVTALAARFAEVLEEELDFCVEARNTITITALHDEQTIRIPTIFKQASSQQVLIQEWMDGVSIREAEPLFAEFKCDRTELARALLRCISRQILTSGTFHADLHPGNVLALRDGQLALIDFGQVGRLDTLQQTALREMLVAFERRDATLLCSALLDIADVDKTTDPARLERILAQFLVRHTGPGMTPDAEMFTEMFRILLAHGLAFPPEIGGVFRAVVTLESTLNLIAPQFPLIDETRILAHAWMQESITPSALQKTVTDELLGLLPTLRQLPKRFDRITRAAERGELTMNVRFFADVRDVHLISRLVSQVVLAVLGAAIGLMGVVLLGGNQGPALTENLSVLHAFGYFSLVISVMLILRVIVTTAREQSIH